MYVMNVNVSHFIKQQSKMRKLCRHVYTRHEMYLRNTAFLLRSALERRMEGDREERRGEERELTPPFRLSPSLTAVQLKMMPNKSSPDIYSRRRFPQH